MAPPRIVPCALVALLGLGGALSGCTSEDHDAAVAYREAVAADQRPDPTGFHARTTFAYRAGKDRWERERDGEFRIRKRAQVRARVAFAGAAPGRTYTVHLVWIRPDGRELFRRVAEASVAAADSGGYVAEVAYVKAADLAHRRTVRDDVRRPGFTVESVFDISRAKNRETGEYLLRVYLDRRLLSEETITVVGS